MQDCRNQANPDDLGMAADLANRKVHQEATVFLIVAHVSLGCNTLRNATLCALDDAFSNIEDHLQQWEGLA